LPAENHPQEILAALNARGKRDRLLLFMTSAIMPQPCLQTCTPCMSTFRIDANAAAKAAVSTS
jgi:hypothetical protein